MTRSETVKRVERYLAKVAMGVRCNVQTAQSHWFTVWSEGKLKFRSYGDTTAVGNGATFIPNTTPIYDLTDADFISGAAQEPITINIIPPEEQFNVCKLEILNRANNYNPLPVEDKDDASIQVNGLRESTNGVITAHEVCDASIAKKIAMFINRRTASRPAESAVNRVQVFRYAFGL